MMRMGGKDWPAGGGGGRGGGSRRAGADGGKGLAGGEGDGAVVDLDAAVSGGAGDADQVVAGRAGDDQRAVLHAGSNAARVGGGRAAGEAGEEEAVAHIGDDGRAAVGP